MKSAAIWPQPRVATRLRAALVLLLGIASGPLQADVFVVDHPGDSGSGSLRQAILDADAAPPGALCDASHRDGVWLGRKSQIGPGCTANGGRAYLQSGQRLAQRPGVGGNMIGLNVAETAAMGAITPANSIIGGNTNDLIGIGGVVQLPSGNVLIISPEWNGVRGAVTCLTPAQYRAGNIVVTAANSLVGSTLGDTVGSGGVTVLSNGNYVVSSPSWDATSSPAVNVGAVTWGDGNTCSTNGSTVSAANSRVGSTDSDLVGVGVTALTNGHYVVRSPSWDGAAADVGAVTWCSGMSGCIGAVSASNSLVGSSLNDQIGGNSVIALTTNGNYVVSSQSWDATSPVKANVGAVTWCDGTSGCTGAVSAATSLTGSTAGDMVGNNSLTPLSNGNYVVSSSLWDAGPTMMNAGAVTWCSGTVGCIGTPSALNSLVGPTSGDLVGNGGVTALTNGNYVVRSLVWDGVIMERDFGAVTWGNGLGGTVGVVNITNSLVGTTANDRVGEDGVTALSNGNYVVRSSVWDAPAPLAVNAGAVTWGNGNGGTFGAVSAANSLVGSTFSDQIGGSGVTALTNGHYVVRSPRWDGVAADTGAATWGNGNGGTVGPISAANSLVGATALDQTGGNGVTALTNGHYVVRSPLWDGAATDVGAATWCDGTMVCTGPISAANSLVGLTASDEVANGGVTALTNGNYVVSSPLWDASNLGAVTWGNGFGGTVGTVNANNSLVGSTFTDFVGSAIALTNGNYVVRSPNWDATSPAVLDVGAVTLGNGLGGTVGAVTATNSLVGSTANDQVSKDGVTALSGGAFMVRSSLWNSPSSAVDVGAVTCSGLELIFANGFE